MPETFIANLQPNKTYANRKAIFVRHSSAPVFGVLELFESNMTNSPSVMLTREKKVKAQKRRYALREESGTDGSARVFRLTKPLGEEPPDPYHVFICFKPTSDRCDCKGFEAGHYCSHLEALRELFAVGAMTPTPSTAPTANPI